jgi:hypothetical protein
MKTSITEEELEILHKYESKKLSYDELQELIPYRLNYEEMKTILLSFKNGTSDELCNKFSPIRMMFPNSMTESEEAKLYRELLYEDWHRDHEMIVADFDRYLRYPENIEAIEYVLFNPPDSAKYADGVVRDDFIKNCIWAISHQPEPYNMESLKKLVKSNNQRISEVALYHIHRIDPNLPEIDFPYL